LCPPEGILQPERMREMATLLHGIDFFFAKATSAARFWPDRHTRLETVAEEIAKLGPRLVILHRGLEGVHLFDAEAQRHVSVSGYPLSPVDITGIEEAFCGGFMAGWKLTFDPIEASLRGVVSSSLVMEGSGALPSFHHLPGIAEKRLQSLRTLVMRNIRRQ
jgi:sugar/nucleoside kinase (ribokinase family)